MSVIEGTDLNTIALENPTEFVRYHRGLQVLHNTLHIRSRVPTQDPVVHWWFGPTGTGKSRTAYELWPAAYWKMNSKWWDAYSGETHVIMDDFRPSADLPFNMMLRILDRYPLRVEAKGTSFPLSATNFLITTTKRPELLWEGKTDEAINQLLRRITTIREFTSEGQQIILKDSVNVYVPVQPAPLAHTFRVLGTV